LWWGLENIWIWIKYFERFSKCFNFLLILFLLETDIKSKKEEFWLEKKEKVIQSLKQMDNLKIVERKWKGWKLRQILFSMVIVNIRKWSMKPTLIPEQNVSSSWEICKWRINSLMIKDTVIMNNSNHYGSFRIYQSFLTDISIWKMSLKKKFKDFNINVGQPVFIRLTNKIVCWA
jgi:hypothetical protein